MEKNLTGSMPGNTSATIPFLREALEDIQGSELPYGFILFEPDGTVSSLCAPPDVIGEDEAASVTLALDFVHYAFDRADWMAEFIKKAYKEKKPSENSDKNRPKLTLIKGGLEENEQKE